MPGDYLHTVGNALKVLLLLQQGAKTVKQIAESLDIDRSASYRILRTLEAHNFAYRDPKENAYALSRVLWELAVAAVPELDLRAIAADPARRLVEKHGETVHLAVYDQGDAVYIDKVDGTRPLRSHTTLGSRAPSYCVAIGKALLAHQPKGERERVLSDGLAAHTPRTIVDPTELREELDQVRKTGVALNRGEWRSEVAGIAVPIVGPKGTISAALGLSGPLERILSHQDFLIRDLREHVNEIERVYQQNID